MAAEVEIAAEELPLPCFRISVSHSGSFRDGQQNATYSITVTNVGNAATSGDVQVTETLTSGEELVFIGGSGWSFAGGGDLNSLSEVTR